MKKHVFFALFCALAVTQTSHPMCQKTTARDRREKMSQLDKTLYEAARAGQINFVGMLLHQTANPYTLNYATGDTAVARVKMLAGKERDQNGPYHTIYTLMTGEILPVVQRRRVVEPNLQNQGIAPVARRLFGPSPRPIPQNFAR